MITPTIINDETAKEFLENLKQKKFMVCFVYYDFGHERKLEDICLDIAKTSYRDNGKFGIQCRGTGYMENIDFEYGKQLEVIKMSIHSFIECEKPVIDAPGNTQQHKLKVVSIDDDSLTFENGVTLYSVHESACCESHYLSLADLTIADFDGLEFDLSNDNFFERIKGYGIALKPLNGHPVRIPGYGINNGYYSSQLELILKGEGFEKVYDVSRCQVIKK